MRGDMWVEEIGEGLTELNLRVRQPAVEHRVRIREWRESQGKTPAVARSDGSDGVGEGKGGSADPAELRVLPGAPIWQMMPRRLLTSLVGRSCA